MDSLFSSFNHENKRLSSNKDASALRSVESTRNQASQMRSFGRDITNIIHQPIYRKDQMGDAYQQQKEPLIPRSGSLERAKRAASVSGNQLNKQFFSKRGSNTFKTHLPNLHNISGTSNSSKVRAASNSSGHNQGTKALPQTGMPGMNTIITMSKEMVSTKVNGLSSLNIVKKKAIKTRRSGTRHDSKSSFASDVNPPQKILLSTHSRGGSSSSK